MPFNMDALKYIEKLKIIMTQIPLNVMNIFQTSHVIFVP